MSKNQDFNLAVAVLGGMPEAVGYVRNALYSVEA
jgi:hypothetical protein